MCILEMINAPSEGLPWSTSQAVQEEHKGLIFSPKTELLLRHQSIRAQSQSIRAPSHKVEDGLSSLFS